LPHRFFSLFRVNLKKKCMFWQEKPIEKCSAGLPKKKATPFMTGGGGGLGASPPASLTRLVRACMVWWSHTRGRGLRWCL